MSESVPFSHGGGGHNCGEAGAAQILCGQLSALPWVIGAKMYKLYALYEIRMSATTLRIEKQQKKRFDRLQATLRVMTGRRVTQADLLDRLLEKGEEAPAALAGKAWRPLSKAELERVMALPIDIGFEIGDVDEALYGRKKRDRS
jgi:hypothetical protein